MRVPDNIKAAFNVFTSQIKERRSISKEFKQFQKNVGKGVEPTQEQQKALKGRMNFLKSVTKADRQISSKITKLALFLSPNPAKARAKFVQAKVKQELQPQMKKVGQDRSLAETLIKDGIQEGKSANDIKKALADQGFTKEWIQTTKISVGEKVAAKTTEWGGEVQDTKIPESLKKDLAFLTKLVNSNDPAATWKQMNLESSLRDSGLNI